MTKAVLGVVLCTGGVICLLLAVAEGSTGTHPVQELLTAGVLLSLLGSGLFAWGRREILQRRSNRKPEVEARKRRSEEEQEP